MMLELINGGAGNLTAIEHSIELVHRPDVSVDASLNSIRLPANMVKRRISMVCITRLEMTDHKRVVTKEYAL